jgi:hypothetical protein
MALKIVAYRGYGKVCRISSVLDTSIRLCHTPRMRWIVLLLFLAAAVARVVLAQIGTLHTDEQLWGANAVVAALGVWAVAAVLSRGLIGADIDKRIGVIAAVIAIPAASVGAVQLFGPATPPTATAPACRGASVAGGAFRATTQEVGVNARSGPGTSYPQIQRFAGNCTLSFDGYCIGEPTNDLIVKSHPDQRWLILHRPWLPWPWRPAPYSFVAAGKVQSQSSEDKLGTAPHGACSKLGGLDGPRPLSMKQLALDKGVVKLRAASSGARIIGLSVMLENQPKDGSDRVFALTDPVPKLAYSDGSIDATWIAQRSGAATGTKRGRVTILSTVCLAPAVPQPHNDAFMQYQWDGKQVRSLPKTRWRIDDEDTRRLHTAACRVSPEYPQSSAVAPDRNPP